MKVIFLSKYGYEGASSRYRFYNYSKYFTNFKFEFKPLLSDTYVKGLYSSKSRRLLTYYKIKGIIKRIFYLLFASSKNLYVIEKELFPNIPYFIENLLLMNKRYLLDYDDFIGAEYTENIFLKNKLSKLVSKSKLTTVGNRWYFEEFNNHKSLRYLPTNIEIEKYRKSEQSNRKTENENQFSIVWIGSPSTTKYLDLVKDAFFKLAEKYSVKFFIIGGRAPFEHKDIQHVKWHEATEVENILKGDIGIMPLYDSLWEKGKCGFKLIQYMGVGLPVLASISPANDEIILDNGFICNSSEEWYERMEQLLLDKELRLQLGKKSFLRAKSRYSYECWGPKYSSWIMEQLKM